MVLLRNFKVCFYSRKLQDVVNLYRNIFFAKNVIFDVDNDVSMYLDDNNRKSDKTFIKSSSNEDKHLLRKK